MFVHVLILERLCMDEAHDTETQLQFCVRLLDIIYFMCFVATLFTTSGNHFKTICSSVDLLSHIGLHSVTEVYSRCYRD